MEKSRLYLKFPTIQDKENVLNYKQEFLENNQKMAGVGGLDRYNNYEEWLEKIHNGTNKTTCAKKQSSSYPIFSL